MYRKCCAIPLTGASAGGVTGGVLSEIMGGDFWDGFRQGATSGAVSGAAYGVLKADKQEAIRKSTKKRCRFRYHCRH